MLEVRKMTKCAGCLLLEHPMAKEHCRLANSVTPPKTVKGLLSDCPLMKRAVVFVASGLEVFHQI